jgi:anti-sigma factor RsiW
MTQENELTCQELVELVTAYLEDALPSDERSRFNTHLNFCPGCATYVDQMRQTIQLVGTLTEDDIGPEARNQLLNVFRAWKHAGSEDA